MKKTFHIETVAQVPAEVITTLGQRQVTTTADLLDIIAASLHRRAAELRAAYEADPLQPSPPEVWPVTITHRLGIDVEVLQGLDHNDLTGRR